MNPNSKPIAVTGGKLIQNNAIQTGKALLIEDAKIRAVCGINDFDANEYQIVDAGDSYVTPGFVDLHVHGCLHHTFNDASEEAFEKTLKKTLSVGVTTLAPTLVAAPIPELERTLNFIDHWKKHQKIGVSEITGAYLESPFIAPKEKGALPGSAIRSLQGDALEKLLNYKDALSVFMIAPELEGAPEAYRKITNAGIIGAMGHTSAIEEQIREAIAAGASHVTHLWSAMSSVVRHGPWRKPGLLEVALTTPEITAEIIADNRHLPPTLMKLAVRSKAWSDSLCVVSDALNGAGLDEGAYFYVGENRCQVVDGVGMVEDRTVFAGSTTLLNREIPVLINEVGVSLPQAIKFVTEIPAKILKINDRKGTLSEGKDADIVLFDQDFNASLVIQKGIIVKQ